MRKAFAPKISARMDAARAHLVANIATLGKIATLDAGRVANEYLRLKIAKLDAVTGTSSVKHGAFFDRDTIARTLAHCKRFGRR